MICSKCKKENIQSANFCKSCGNKLRKENDKKTVKALPTTQGKRFANLILDNITLYIGGFIVGFVLGFIGLYGLIENINNYILGAIMILVFYTFFEYNWGKTPGKFITKTKVVMEGGKKLEFQDVFVRNLIRLIPFEAFSFLSSKNPRGWHDRWSKTIVIDDK